MPSAYEGTDIISYLQYKYIIEKQHFLWYSQFNKFDIYRMKKSPLRRRRSTCKTGLESFLLDPSLPACPYIECHNGETCSLYEPMQKEIKQVFEKTKE